MCSTTDVWLVIHAQHSSTYFSDVIENTFTLWTSISRRCGSSAVRCHADKNACILDEYLSRTARYSIISRLPHFTGARTRILLSLQSSPRLMIFSRQNVVMCLRYFSNIDTDHGLCSFFSWYVTSDADDKTRLPRIILEKKGLQKGKKSERKS